MPKVLVVDDDECISKALAVRLEQAGFEVVLAYDGVSGMSTAVREQPDLILLDISMPAGDGFSLAEKISKNDGTLGTPLIFMTASKRPELATQVRKHGAVAFFEKPFESELLIQTIRQTLEANPATIE